MKIPDNLISVIRKNDGAEMMYYIPTNGKEFRVTGLKARFQFIGV